MENVLDQCIWLNKDVGLENAVGRCAQSLKGKGILYVKDLFDNERKRFLTPSAVRNRYGIHTIMAMSICQKIPLQWKALTLF